MSLGQHKMLLSQDVAAAAAATMLTTFKIPLKMSTIWASLQAAARQHDHNFFMRYF
jgi:hypothetical protein